MGRPQVACEAPEAVSEHAVTPAPERGWLSASHAQARCHEHSPDVCVSSLWLHSNSIPTAEPRHA
jgi:hypothetical protein